MRSDYIQGPTAAPSFSRHLGTLATAGTADPGMGRVRVLCAAPSKLTSSHTKYMLLALPSFPNALMHLLSNPAGEHWAKGHPV